ncbi:Trp biosynthesis-associated membrane protein [Amycolatopsis sp. DR6-1]|uniref:Trp biosynthesis-associated membrane protein n=2 Tax=Amycolatopsis TaxID=1813 RepID=A0A7W3ZAL1_9PSEU|nr:Trp biosynthesis-associated membrane protein [Amycolatopsis dendrobii]
MSERSGEAEPRRGGAEAETEAPSAGGGKAKRPLWTIILALLLGALALWGASRMVWFAEFRDEGVRGTVLYTEPGEQRATALVPLAILALAGVAGAVATGGWLRRALGIVLVLAGAAGVWNGVAGIKFGGFAPGLPGTEIVLGHLIAVLGGILVALGGLAAIKWAGAARKLGARYAAPGAKAARKDPDTELWEALSEGDDPTDPPDPRR